MPTYMMRYLMCSLLLTSITAIGIASADDMQSAMDTEMESTKATMEEAIADKMKESMETPHGMMQTDSSEKPTTDSDKGSMEMPVGKHKM